MQTKEQQKEYQQTLEEVVGLRPTTNFLCYNQEMTLVPVTPEDIFIKASTTELSQKFGTEELYHIPRTLCERIRLVRNKETGKQMGNVRKK